MTPRDMPTPLDKLCGAILLGTKTKVYKNCKGGAKPWSPCETDENCQPGGKCQAAKGRKGCSAVVKKQCSQLEYEELAALAT